MSSKMKTYVICFCFLLASLIIMPAMTFSASSSSNAAPTTEHVIGWWGVGGHWGGGWGGGHYWGGGWNGGYHGWNGGWNNGWNGGWNNGWYNPWYYNYNNW